VQEKREIFYNFSFFESKLLKVDLNFFLFGRRLGSPESGVRTSNIDTRTDQREEKQIKPSGSRSETPLKTYIHE